MENRERIIELLIAVRHTTNDIEKVADEICSLFSVVRQSDSGLLTCQHPYNETEQNDRGQIVCKKCNEILAS